MSASKYLLAALVLLSDLGVCHAQRLTTDKAIKAILVGKSLQFQNRKSLVIGGEPVFYRKSTMCWVDKNSGKTKRGRWWVKNGVYHSTLECGKEGCTVTKLGSHIVFRKKLGNGTNTARVTSGNAAGCR